MSGSGASGSSGTVFTTGGGTSTYLSFNTLGSVSSSGVITSVSVTERTGKSLGNRVVTFGLPFAAGEAPSGIVASINGQALPTQVDVKRRHPDGSIRHAVVSVGLPSNLSASSTEVEIRQSGAAASGTPLTVTAALAGGFDFVIEVVENGVTYRASAASLLRAATPAQWLTGALATEYRVSGPLKSGAVEHSNLEAWFDIRFLAPDSVRVSVVLENTVVNATRGERYGAIRILDEAGRAVFAQPTVYIPAHSRMRKVFDWGGSNQTAIHVAPKLAYLVRTGAAPSYDVSKTLHPSAITDVTASLTSDFNEIYGSGPITSWMPMTGGRSDLGILPRWTAVALYTGNADAYRVMLNAGELAGSFPIHLRNPNTRKPYSIDRNPSVTIGWWGNKESTPQDSLPDCGTRCPTGDIASDDPRRTNTAIYKRIHTFDTAHQPSLAFMPYVLTGDAFFLEELHFWVAANFMALPPSWRNYAAGLFIGDLQTRGQAWSMRTLAQAAWITPDGWTEEKAYHEQKLLGNIDHYLTNIAPSDPWAGLNAGKDLAYRNNIAEMATDVYSAAAPWQVDYFATVMGYVEGLGYAQATPMRAWLNTGLIARITSGGWNPYDATPWQVAIRYVPAGCGILASPSSTAGCPSVFPIYPSVSAAYQATFARRASAAPTSLPEATCSGCLPSIARAALSSAARVDHPNARQAYAFIHGEMERQISTITASGQPHPFLRDPTWLIVP